MADRVAYEVRPIGVISSPLTSLADAPMQGSEGAPDAWLEIDAALAPALLGIAAGDELIVITWFHRADRAVLQTRPRSDPRNPMTGVFATRSPDRPNRSACIWSPCARSTATGCASGRSKRSTARPSSTSSRC
jgi:tRNA (Thr-GGU) A37 N-methylase